MIHSIFIDAINKLLYWLHSNLVNISNVLEFICPYIMVSLYINSRTGRFLVWLLPPFFWLVAYVLKEIANKTGKGLSIPKPIKRFTEVSEDGEITIPMDRVEELIVFMYDLEEWYERKGY